MQIKELDQKLIQECNRNSFYNSGSTTEKDYLSYCSTVLSWDISKEKKEGILNKIYQKFSKHLQVQSRHVSVMVAGSANYNAKKLDQSDKILKSSYDFVNWFKELESQYKNSQKDYNTTFEEFIECANRMPESIDYLLNDFIKEKNQELFIKAFEYIEAKGIKKYRKNTNMYKLYSKAKNGEQLFKQKEIVFENADYTVFIEDERVFVKFIFKPKRQLIVALKSRGYFWNAHKDCWSTYLSKLDKEWVSNLSVQYKNYI